MRRRTLRRSSRRAGLSLVEMAVVAGLAGLFVVFLAGTVVTSTTMNRDTYVENELVDLANRTADEVAGAISVAGRFTDAFDLSAAGDQLEFQETWHDASFVRIYGVRLSAGALSPGGVKRLVWVQERTYAETAVRCDVDGDGFITAGSPGTIAIGRLELRTFVVSGSTRVEQTGMRRIFGGGSVRFVRNALALGSVKMFSRPPMYANTATTMSLTETLRPTLVVRTSDDVAAGNPVVLTGETAEAEYTPFEGQPDPAVQINLRIVFNPIPGPGGRPELHAMNVTRIATPR